MAFSKEYRAEVEEKLGAVVSLRSRAMFGGVGLYANDIFFALIAEDRLYFKIGDLNRADYEEAGSEMFYPYDSPTPMPYSELPAGIIDKPEELLVWAERSIAVAESGKAKKKPKRNYSA